MEPTEEKPTELEQLQLRVRQLEQLADNLEEALHVRRERDYHSALIVAGVVIGFALAMHLVGGAS
jgi:shikimate kinase